MKYKIKFFYDEGNGRVEFNGESDCVDTHCCCLTPSWFVKVVEWDWEGYIEKKDCRKI